MMQNNTVLYKSSKEIRALIKLLKIMHGLKKYNTNVNKSVVFRFLKRTRIIPAIAGMDSGTLT